MAAAGVFPRGSLSENGLPLTKKKGARGRRLDIIYEESCNEVDEKYNKNKF